MNQVAIHLKQTQHCKSTILQYKITIQLKKKPKELYCAWKGMFLRVLHVYCRVQLLAGGREWFLAFS